jgi:uncharacterized protein YukE
VTASHPATVVPPQRYSVPTINGDPDAAYRLATAFRELADAVRTAQQRVALIIGGLSGSWRGLAHEGVTAPTEAFVRNAALLARVLDEAADEIDAYGRQLAAARHHHGFSFHKLLKVGAVVAVSATAVVVTVGAAGVVEAAAATAAVSGATAAAETATAADVAAATGLETVVDSLSGMRPLLAFVLPHLVQLEWTAGAMAAWDEATLGRMRWRAVAETGAVAFVASGVAAKGIEVTGGPGWGARLVEGGVWSGAAATDDQLTEGRIDIADIAESFVLAGGGTAARDTLRANGWWPAEPDYHREALLALARRPGVITDPEIAHEMALLRQPARDLLRGGVDLRLSEGPGHTLSRHTSQSAWTLLDRARTGRSPVTSSYWDEPAARDAVQRALTTHRDVVRRWIDAGCPDALRLRSASPYDIGYAITRSGHVTFVRSTMVVLRRDGAGVLVVTSYPFSR